LSSRAPSAAPDVVLCATQRLARRLRLAPDAAPGTPARMTRTIGQWLDETLDAALLAGALLDAPQAGVVLSPLQERKLWQRVIEAALRKDDTAALFSLDGLARTAQEAHALATLWRLPLQRADRLQLSEETQCFLDWRSDFLRRCRAGGWRDAASHTVWQIEQIEAGLGDVPPRLAFAGFDRLNPQEERLRSALARRGVDVVDWPLGRASDAQARQCRFADADAELRAVAQWVAERRAATPDARLGIVVPELAMRRAALCRVLDATLAPAFCGLGDAPDGRGERFYNVSLGEPLAEQPLVRTALALLRLAQTPWQIEQDALGTLLTGVGWANDFSEADVRARFEARCRARLPALVSLERVLRMARHEAEKGAQIAGLLVALTGLQQWAAGLKSKSRRLPSRWATAFGELLDVAGWPGERTLSSNEYQAQQAFRSVLQNLGGLDDVLGETSVGDALSALADACGDTVFQAETEGSPNIQVLGMLEAATEDFDALWVCGLTDAVWPPAARPNPLLPAAMLRAAGCPNASPEVQSRFAGDIHRRFLHAAPEVIFSLPERDGERELASSPLLAAIPFRDAAGGMAVPAGRVACLQAAAPPLDAILDAQGPPIADQESVAGGTWLLRAQAICPAWAFYQYRLGADGLETPIEGLDARGRGRLVHLVLEAFWRGRSLADLQAMCAAEAEAAIVAAVDAGMAAHAAAEAAAGVGAALPERFAALERVRLIKLLRAWIAVELQREIDFHVHACEEEHSLDLHGIAVNIVVDRIDQLADGRRLVIDYKTGRSVDAKSWAADRISEPQLPIYATYTVAPVPLAGIAFAQVVLDKPGFVGVSEQGGLLPKVKGLAESRKLYPEERFANWPALLEHWQRALHDVAVEIRAGDARVSFTDEAALAYCDVLPLLRLSERRRLYEAALPTGAEFAKPPVQADGQGGEPPSFVSASTLPDRAPPGSEPSGQGRLFD
jgi:probable DNA repair protein